MYDRRGLSANADRLRLIFLSVCIDLKQKLSNLNL